MRKLMVSIGCTLAVVTGGLLGPQSSQASPAYRQTVTIRVYGDPGVSRRVEKLWLRDIAFQANGMFRHYWRTPRVRFALTGSGTYAWALDFEKYPGGPDVGLHWLDGLGGEDMIVYQDVCSWPSATASHEVLESLADYAGAKSEVVDKVNGDSYAYESAFNDGVALADYMLPSGRDYMGFLPKR